MKKRILIAILMVFVWFISVAQIGQYKRSYKSIVENTYSNEYKTLVDRNGLTYDWGTYGSACYGCASFYVKIMRDVYPINGMYTYYVFFFSNSYDTYGYLSGTYITGINISKINNLGYFQNITFIDYFLVNQKTDYFDGINLAATFYSNSPSDPITITWQNFTVY